MMEVYERKKGYHRHTKESLTALAKDSKSVCDILRKLGLRIDGNTHTYISRRIKELNVDISHFVSQTHYLRGGTNKVKFSDVLVFNRHNNRREQSSRLRQALLESGRPYECVACHNRGEWNGKPLLLEMDHINENGLDNRPENLQFLCPNCHSQKSVK